MNETEQLWCDLLNEWHDNTNNVGEPEMSLENQAKYLAKKHPIKIYTKVIKHYDSTSEETLEIEEDRALVCISKVVVKYRPHLHMGDYWLDINFVNGVQQYIFHLIEDLGNDEYLIQDAKHPHINNSKPCLGTYQGDLGTAFIGCNYIQFMSLMKAFLSTYTGNDTYFRGTNFKKKKIYCQLYSSGQINDIFSEESESDTGIDVYSVAQDPMRWNWPKDMAAWNTIEIQGQENFMLIDYWRKTEYPTLQNVYRSDLRNYGDKHINKILGYVSIAYNIGELSLIQSFEFVRIFLLTLKAHYEGNMDSKTQTELKKLTNELYTCRRQRGVQLNTRYNIALDSEKMSEVDQLWNEVEPFYNTSNNDAFLLNMKWAGDKLTNFVVLLRKKAPHKAAANYLFKVRDYVDVNKIGISYRRIRKHACTLALQQLEKDKRRFINELNKPETNNTIPDVGQGTLFS